MKYRGFSTDGFLIVEVLVVIAILAVSFVIFMGAMAQALKISSRSSRLSEAVSQYEPFLFELESGLRLDRVDYGGEGSLDKSYHYRIDVQKYDDIRSFLKSRLSWNDGKESLDLGVLVLRVSAQ